MSIVFAVQIFNQIDRPLDDAERLQAQKVHLQQPHLFDRRAFKLRNQIIRTGLFIQRQKIRQRLIGDHHAAGVYRGVPGQSFQPSADINHLVRLLVLVVGLL